MKRKFITLALSISLLTCNLFTCNLFTCNIAYASDTSVNTTFTQSLTQEEAKVILGTFVSSQIESDDNCPWTTSTKIIKSDILYDNNDDISGYTFQLETNSNYTGYVTIGTNLNYNFIHEFSYTDKPFYSISDSEPEKIYYVGPINYLIENDNEIIDVNSLIDAQQITTSAGVEIVEKDELENTFQINSLTKRKENLQIKNIVDEAIKKFNNDDPYAVMPLGYSGQYENNSYVITNISSYLGDKFTGYNYKSSKSLSGQLQQDI